MNSPHGDEGKTRKSPTEGKPFQTGQKSKNPNWNQNMEAELKAKAGTTGEEANLQSKKGTTQI